MDCGGGGGHIFKILSGHHKYLVPYLLLKTHIVSRRPGQNYLHLFCVTDQPLSNIDRVITNLKRSIPTVSMAAAICDKFGDKVLNERTEIMTFIRVTMEHCLSFDSELESYDLKMEMLSISLAVLSLMLNVKVCICPCCF